MRKLYITTFLCLFCASLFSRTYLKLVKEDIIKEYEVKMWQETAAYFLELPKKKLERYNTHEKIIKFIQRYQCKKRSCDTEPLELLIEQTSAVNVFYSTKSVSKGFALENLLQQIEGLQNHDLTAEVKKIFHIANSDQLLIFFNQRSNNEKKKDALLNLLKRRDNAAIDQLIKLKTLTAKATKAACEDSPLDCMACCLLIKKVLPAKLNYLKNKTPKYEEKLRISLLDAQKRTSNQSISDETIDKIINPTTHSPSGQEALAQTDQFASHNSFSEILSSIIFYVPLGISLLLIALYIQERKKRQAFNQISFQAQFKEAPILVSTQEIQEELPLETIPLPIEEEPPPPRPIQFYYAARPDGNNSFLQENLSNSKEHKLPYIIEVWEEGHAKYRLNDDPSVQQQALDSAYYVLYEACNYKGRFPTNRNMKIINLNDGELQRKNNEWVIVKKLEIDFDKIT